ncbi:MAG: TonB-dependent receptor [Candidatus Marinimicrobia bacterium]|nr:TonB-dependent receptor [Candidatus Neomarinimicrobiota bacterium]
MQNRISNKILSCFLLVMTCSVLWGQTTGKIAGKVSDSETGNPLVGVNIIIKNTYWGAATDENGLFYIMNISPGNYDVSASSIGYAMLTIQDVNVNVNATTNLEFKLQSSVLQGEEVVVQAERISVKKDQTGSVRHVSSEQISALPVENLSAVINMQAGVVDGHFRGGRVTEVSYLIDGIQVDDSFGGQYSTVDLEAEAIQNLEVITGTFNAEYGRAMSGVVNAVTKDGSKKVEGSASVNYGNYYTGNTEIFEGLSLTEFNRNQDYKILLSGPIIGETLTFFTNFRYQNNNNHLNGIRRFNVDDYSLFIGDENQWYTEATGDSLYVPMNNSENSSFMGKLTLNLKGNFRTSLMYSLNKDLWRGYNHQFRFNPDGMGADHRQTDMFAFSLNHMLSPRFFYELKLSNMKNYYGWYVFEDPTDSGYVHDTYLENTGTSFFTGGQQKDHTQRTLTDQSVKFDINWQMNNNHNIKTGVNYLLHTIDNKYSAIRNAWDGDPLENTMVLNPDGTISFPYYQATTLPDSSVYSDIYKVSPLEFSAYIQDKMEFDEMVINFGLRFDYFDPQSVYPSDLRNPANQLLLPDSMMSLYPKTETQSQISPRLGLAYQLSNAAVLHFSYGHFFQMPPLYALYQNHAFRISPSDYETTLGNSRLKAEKTVTYEIGLWQEVTKNIGIEVALYYRDIYDLLSTRIVSTYNQIEYGLYTNKDYGNARGLEVKVDIHYGAFFSNFNYTLQYTRGIADNPTQTFTRAGDSMDPITRLIPMPWDQRHTLNLSAGYNTSRYGATLTAYYGSGSPYTFSPIQESPLARVNLYPNNDTQPAHYSIDLNGFYSIKLFKGVDTRITFAVYNLLDRLNPVWVYGSTGQPYTDIIRQSDIENHRSNFSTIYDVIQNPAMYSAPRYVKLGLGVVF